MEKNNFALRLLPSLLKSAQRVAERENCSVNQLINVALAEKLAILEEDRWKQRADAALRNPRASGVLERLAGNEPPRKGDEIPVGTVGKRKPKALTAQG